MRWTTVWARVAATVAVAVLGSTVAATFLAYQLERNSEQDRFTSDADYSAIADVDLAHTVADHQTLAKAVVTIRRALASRVSLTVGLAVVDGDDPGADGGCPAATATPANTVCVASLPAQVSDVLEAHSGDGLFFNHGMTYASVHTITLDNGSHAGLVELFDYTAQLRQLSRLRNDLLWLDTAALAVAVVLGLLVASGISRPVRRTARAARRLGDGDLDTRIPERGSRELAQLARNFNAMAQRLSDTLSDLRASQTLQQRFVADVSHELRTPLAAMVAADEGLDSADRARRERATVLVRTQTRRMAKMIDDLLEMSRFDAGQADLDLEPVDLVELARDAIRAVAPDAGVRITSLGDVTVDVDARRVHTVLRNLITNALQHGEPPVDVLVDGQADAVVVTVADDGPGVPAELVETVFDRFVRADTARTGDGTNTGLGLAIAAENARLHGASLGVSTTGRTAFALRLPRRPTPGAPSVD